MPSARLIHADVLHGITRLDQEVSCIVTSPPYYWQRAYGVPNEIGLEPSPSEYIARLVEVFAGAREHMCADAVAWVNLGDSYNNRVIARQSSHQSGLGHDSDDLRLTWAEQRKAGRARLSVKEGSLKEKDAIGIPWRFAEAMRDDGWYVRAEVIWEKTYGNPDGTAHDRPSRTHETLFLFSRSSSYFFDRSVEGMASSVWRLPPGQDGEHGATFPPELPRRCILASTQPDDLVLDPFVGSGTTVEVAVQCGRQGVGIDGDGDAIAQAQRRLAAVQMELA